jgi:hypothetical protein
MTPKRAPTNQVGREADVEWESRLKKLDDIVINLEGMATDRYGSPVPWDRGTLYVTLTLVIMTTLVMMIRPDFLSMSLALGALYYLIIERPGSDTFVPTHFKLIALAILGSILVDISWFMFATPHWSTSKIADGLENPIKDLSIVLSVVNVFVKLAVSFAFWRNALK